MFKLDAVNMINAKFDALTMKMDKLSMKVNSSVGGSSNLVDVGATNINSATDFSAFSQDFSSEQCNAVTLRSGKLMGEEHEIEVKLKEKKNECESESTSTKAKASKEANVEKEDKKKIEEKYVPPFGKFLKVLKKLYINIPFTDVISQMPSDAKFLREILSNKRRLEDYETVALTEECNAILQNKLPPKLKDP
ncbi:uncharacterized protein LOC110661353 [Hevea brasiliensis]|uniref:uncharacterized protein LOC110661353 n=1 Tax=Hevea brasiliensis TaxID=3981 RepID=UPI0025EE8E1A|nr:uncharacterized protein LOC110661353 [Hevea brasiliensis]